MSSEIKKATYTLLNFTSDNKIGGPDTIPRELLATAKGIAFLTVVKAGFMFSGRIGTGLVVARLGDGSWSAPSAIMLTGLGWGAQFGGELTDVVLVLATDGAVEAFSSRAQISVGTELAVSVGPVGRSAGTDIHAGSEGASVAFTYAHSKGLFIGVSLEASTIFSRADVNRNFYGMDVKPSALLSGEVQRPKAAEPLYKALTEVLEMPSRTSRAATANTRRRITAPPEVGGAATGAERGSITSSMYTDQGSSGASDSRTLKSALGGGEDRGGRSTVFRAGTGTGVSVGTMLGVNTSAHNSASVALSEGVIGEDDMSADMVKLKLAATGTDSAPVKNGADDDDDDTDVDNTVDPRIHIGDPLNGSSDYEDIRL
jgi:lipid-binding SYLF domain-containing protein